MSNIFGMKYSQAYDVLYQDKDYLAECDLLEEIFKKYSSQPIRSILDLGCGTGNHAIPLATRGYTVTGVDRAQEMLNLARVKAQQEGLTLTFHQADIQKVNLGQTFDAVLMMFAVMGYQPENIDVLAALRAARSHLNRNGILMADVWYGPAVLAQRPGDRIRVFRVGDKEVIRTASGELDIHSHTCKVDIHLWEINKDKVVAKTEEQHRMRFFFPRELELFLEISGFRLLRLGAFPEFDRDPDESNWNIILVAKVV